MTAEVVVSRSVRINTGNYEGTEQFVSMKAEVDEVLGDTYESVHAALATKVELAVTAQLQRSYTARGKREMGADAKKVAKHHGLGSALAHIIERTK